MSQKQKLTFSELSHLSQYYSKLLWSSLWKEVTFYTELVCPISNRFTLSATSVPFSGLNRYISLSHCVGVVLPSPRLTKTGVQPEGAPGRGVHSGVRLQLRTTAQVITVPSSHTQSRKKPWPHKTGALLETSLVVPWERICLPANAGEVGSIPGLGTAHMLQSNLACGPESLWGLCSETRGATEMRSSHTKTRSYLPLVTTRETPNSKGDPSAA